MARVKWKRNFYSSDVIRLILKLQTQKNYSKRSLFIFKKNSVIPIELNEYTIKVHKGNNFRPLQINQYNTGFKFGNFTLTRKPFNYPLKTKKKNILIKR